MGKFDEPESRVTVVFGHMADIKVPRYNRVAARNGVLVMVTHEGQWES